MSWTKETPAKEGVYWYWPGQDLSPVIAELYDQAGDGLELDESWASARFPSELDGYWWGPIEPPDLPAEEH